MKKQKKTEKIMTINDNPDGSFNVELKGTPGTPSTTYTFKDFKITNEETGDSFEAVEVLKSTESPTKSSTGSLRYNNGKPEVSQLDPNFIIALADHMTKSSIKYGKYNWALGQEYHTPFDSAMRHLMDFMAGSDLDEDGRCNLTAAACNIMILFTSARLKKSELDTRFKNFKD